MKAPRHASPELERLVLGALLDAEGGILRSRAGDLLASTGLTPDDFASEPHRAWMGAIRALADRGRPTDAPAVFAVCRGLSGHDEGTLDVLSELQGSNACTREALAVHAEELRRLSHLRRLDTFLRAQLSALSTGRPQPAVLAQALAEFSDGFAATSEADETGQADVSEVLEDWDAAANGIRTPYLPTGIDALDEQVSGFVPNLNVIGGLPSVGKSALVGEIIMACLEAGHRVGLFGLEDATKWLTKRHIARGMGLPVSDVGAVRLNEWQQEQLGRETQRLWGLAQNLLVYRRAGISPADLVQRCKRWVVTHGVKAIFVDHGGEVRHEGGNRERHDLAVANTYRQLRDLAVNHRVPIVVLCHFNRSTATDRSGVPTMQSFAETEYIARMARLALGLWEKPGDSRLRVTVLKRTEGQRGITVGLERDARCALVKRHGGEVIDLQAEAQADAQAARDAKEAKSWRKQAG